MINTINKYRKVKRRREMKKFLLTAVIMLGLGVSNASAITIEFDVQDLYDWGRLYDYSATTNTWTPYNVNPSDVPAGFTAPVVAGTVGNADGVEDTWGVATVARISVLAGADTYNSATDPYELTMIFYGFDDDYLSAPDLFNNSIVGSTGGNIKIYKDLTPDFDETLGTAGRTGASTYTGVTDGELVLDLIAIPQNIAGHTLATTFNFGTLSGSGSVLLSTTGAGSWDAAYDTNSQLDGADFGLQFTSSVNGGGSVVADWVVRGDGRAESATNSVPEPMTMALFGTGLLGAAIRRKILG
ncbi:MAG: hypothetical protein ACI9F2_000042 [Lysobacterales bacterium]